MALSFLGAALPAYSKTYLNFYEVITDGEAPFRNCMSGEISNEIKAIETSLNGRYSGSTFGIVCLPKWYIVDDPSKKTVVLVPYSLGDMITSYDVRLTMNDLLFKLPKCSEDLQTCIEPAAFEHPAYEYNDVNVFPNFTQDSYDFESFLGELTSPALPSPMRIQIVKLIQANLTPEDYIPNTWVDGAIGARTRKILKQFFDGLKTQYPDAVPRDVLFTNLFPKLVQLVPDQKLPSPLKLNNTETEVDQSRDSEITQPQLEVLDLRKQLEEQQELFVSLKESHEKEISSLKATNAVLLSTIEALSNLKPPENAGKLARLEQELDELTKKYEGSQKIASALLIENQLLLDQSKKVDAVSKKIANRLTKLEAELRELQNLNSSVELKLQSDIDPSRLPDDKQFEKIPDFIKSVTSTRLLGFNEVDTNSCWVGLKLLDEENRDTGTTIDLWMQVLDVDGRIEAKLTDFDTVAAKQIPWRNRKIQLIDLKPNGQKNSCHVSPEPIQIVALGDYKRIEQLAPNKPIATIAFEGEIQIFNAPVMPSKKRQTTKPQNPLKFP